MVIDNSDDFSEKSAKEILSEAKKEIVNDMKNIIKNLNIAAKYFLHANKIKKDKTDEELLNSEEGKNFAVAVTGMKNNLAVVGDKAQDFIELHPTNSELIPFSTLMQQANHLDMENDRFQRIIEGTCREEAEILPLLDTVEKGTYLPSEISDHNLVSSKKNAPLVMDAEILEDEPLKGEVIQTKKQGELAQYQKEGNFIDMKLKQDQLPVAKLNNLQALQDSYFPLVTDDNTLFKNGLPYDPVRQYMDNLAKNYAVAVCGPQASMMEYPVFESFDFPQFDFSKPNHDNDFKMTFKNKKEFLKMARSGDDITMKYKFKGDSLNHLMCKALGNGIESYIANQRSIMWQFAKNFRDKLRDRDRSFTHNENIKVKREIGTLKQPYMQHPQVFIMPLNNRMFNIYDQYIDNAKIKMS